MLSVGKIVFIALLTYYLPIMLDTSRHSESHSLKTRPSEHE